MAWTTIPNSDIDQDSPVTQPLMTALRDNPEAIVNGDVGAPRLQIAAFQEVAAGDVIKLFNDSTASATNTSFVTTIDFNILQSGTIRATLRHRAVAGGTSEARILNGSTVINTWTTTSASFQSRSADFAVAPGNRIRFQHRNALASNTTEMDNRRILTSGAYVLPFNTADFSDINV